MRIEGAWPAGAPCPAACVLCEAPTEIVGLWADPGPAALVGLAAWGFGLPAPGKRRLIVYGLCGPCAVRPDVAEAVELLILAGPALERTRAFHRTALHSGQGTPGHS